MSKRRRWARINTKALLILVVVTGIVGILAFGSHYVRKRKMAQEALVQGQALLEKQQWSEACKHLHRYLLQYPDDVEVLRRYAEANLAVRPRTLDTISAAIAAYRRLLRHVPGDDAISDELAKLYLRVGDHENAIYICEKRLEVAPGDASATILRARVLLTRHKPGEAAAILKPLVEQDPQAVEAYAMLARSELEADDSNAGITRALEWLDLSVQNIPSSAGALVARAAFHLDDFGQRKGRDVESARADLEAAEALDPTGPALLLRLARAWVTIGDADRTRALLSRLDTFDEEALLAEDIVPDDFELGRLRVAASLYQQTGDVQKMGELADGALSRRNDAYRAAFLPTAVELYALSGRVDDARRTLHEYREMVEQATRGREAVNEDLAVLSARVAAVDKRPYDVINLLKPVVDWNAANVTAWRLLADAYGQTGQDRLALEALQQATTRRGGDAASLEQLVREQFRRGDWPAALRSARDLELQSPGNLQAQLLRIEAEMRYEFSRPIRSEAIPRLNGELADLRRQHPDSTTIRILQSAIAEHGRQYDVAQSILETAIEECTEAASAAMRLGGFLERRERPDDALVAYRKAVELDPTASSAWIAVARLQESRGQYEAAQATLLEAAGRVQGDSERRRILLILSRLRLVRSDRAGAIASLEELAAEDPSDAASRLLLLEVPEVLTDPVRTDQYLGELKAIQGKWGVEWRFHQARAWLQREDWRSHVAEIDEALKFCIEQKPRWWTRAAVVRGTMYQQLGDAARAEEVYRNALALEPRATDVVERLLALLEQQKRFAEAKAVLDQLDEAALSSPQLDAHRLGVAIGVGEYEDAIKELQTQIAADPQAAAERIVMARLLYKQRRDVDGAFKLLDEAETIEPGSIPAISARAAILIAEDRSAEAEALLDQVVASRQDFASYLLRGEFHAGQGHKEAAERDFQHLTTFEDTRAVGYQMLGRFYANTGRADEAIRAWEDGLRADPERTSIQRMLMQALLSSGAEDSRRRGREMLESLIAEQPDDPDLHALRASLLLDEETAEATASAREELERVVTLDDRSVTAHLVLIDLDFAAGDLAGAAAKADRALRANPNDPKVLMAAARVQRLRNNASLADDFARAALKADPAHVPAYTFLIEGALSRGDRATGEDLLAAAERYAPEDWLVKFKRAEALDAAGQTADAIGILESLLADGHAGESGQVATSLASLYCKQGIEDKFESTLAEAARLGADDKTLVQIRLRCLFAKRQFDAIAGQMSEYRSNHPQDAETAVLAASLLAATGLERYQRQALALFEQLVETDSKNVPAQLGLAQVGYLLGETDTAIRGYRGVLAADPNHPRALNDLAWLLAEHSQPEALEESLDLVNRGVTLYPTDPHLLDTRGVVRTKRGGPDDLRQAADDLSKAIEFARDPDLPATRARAMVHLAEVYIAQGKPTDAIQQLDQAETVQQQSKVLSEDEMNRIADLRARCR